MSEDDKNHILYSLRQGGKSLVSNASRLIEKMEDYPLEAIRIADYGYGGDIDEIIPFIHKDMSISQVYEAIRFVDFCKVDNKKEIIQDALRICDDKTNWVDQLTVLYATMKTPHTRKSLEEAEKQFTPDMPWSAKLNLFLSVNDQMNKEMKEQNQPIIEGANTQKNKELLEKFKESDSEEDFSEIDISDFATPLPKTSLFADTDLVLCKEDFEGVLPLNGIKLSKLNEIEELVQQIYSGKGKIKLDSEDPEFEKKVQGYIKKLSTRKIGRELIKSVLNNSNINSLTIKAGEEDFVFYPMFSDDLVLKLAVTKENFLIEGEGENSQRIYYELPDFLSLGHELIHVSHYPETIKNVSMPPNLHSDYEDFEEQITISGFKKKIEFSDSQDENTEDDLFNEDSFNRINERNLTAAFANSNQQFYARIGHHAIPRKSAILLSVKERVATNLFQQWSKAPLPLKKTYAELMKDVKPIKET